jgi:hypothetical protein
MRIKQNWMELSQDEINGLSEENWNHYSNGGCVCFADNKGECICGAWWRDE